MRKFYKKCSVEIVDKENPIFDYEEIPDFYEDIEDDMEEDEVKFMEEEKEGIEELENDEFEEMQDVENDKEEQKSDLKLEKEELLSHYNIIEKDKPNSDNQKEEIINKEQHLEIFDININKEKKIIETNDFIIKIEES